MAADLIVDVLAGRRVHYRSRTAERTASGRQQRRYRTSAVRRWLMQARVGDRIVIASRKVGDPRRSGAVVEVFIGRDNDHYRVRWDDGHESIFYPSSDATVEHSRSTV
jgi:hypothetical protein